MQDSCLRFLTKSVESPVCSFQRAKLRFVNLSLYKYFRLDWIWWLTAPKTHAVCMSAFNALSCFGILVFRSLQLNSLLSLAWSTKTNSHHGRKQETVIWIQHLDRLSLWLLFGDSNTRLFPLLCLHGSRWEFKVACWNCSPARITCLCFGFAWRECSRPKRRQGAKFTERPSGFCTITETSGLNDCCWKPEKACLVHHRVVNLEQPKVAVACQIQNTDKNRCLRDTVTHRYEEWCSCGAEEVINLVRCPDM